MYVYFQEDKRKWMKQKQYLKKYMPKYPIQIKDINSQTQKLSKKSIRINNMKSKLVKVKIKNP